MNVVHWLLQESLRQTTGWIILKLKFTSFTNFMQNQFKELSSNYVWARVRFMLNEKYKLRGIVSHIHSHTHTYRSWAYKSFSLNFRWTKLHAYAKKTFSIFRSWRKNYAEHRLNCLKIYVWIEYNGMQHSASSLFLLSAYKHTHTHSFITYKLSCVVALIFFVWWHCLCSLLLSFCPNSHPKKLYHFIMQNIMKNLLHWRAWALCNAQLCNWCILFVWSKYMIILLFIRKILQFTKIILSKLFRFHIE